ncbi:MAG: response regulator [Bacteroidetes bacterium]|nr:response regulator [Bacteroidota bacterium]
MSNEQKIKLFLIDDDAVFLKSMEIEFSHFPEFSVETYSTGELAMTKISNAPDVVILDYHLDGIEKDAMNGMATLDKIKAHNSEIPVVMLSSQDKIEVAIDCMHHKAFDYVVKSETAFMRLQAIISAILKYKKMEKQLSWYMERM